MPYFRREVGYIVGRALEYDSRVVTFGRLVFLSNQTRDAGSLTAPTALLLAWPATARDFLFAELSARWVPSDILALSGNK